MKFPITLAGYSYYEIFNQFLLYNINLKYIPEVGLLGIPEEALKYRGWDPEKNISNYSYIVRDVLCTLMIYIKFPNNLNKLQYLPLHPLSSVVYYNMLIRKYKNENNILKNYPFLTNFYNNKLEYEDVENILNIYEKNFILIKEIRYQDDYEIGIDMYIYLKEEDIVLTKKESNRLKYILDIDWDKLRYDWNFFRDYQYVLEHEIDKITLS